MEAQRRRGIVAFFSVPRFLRGEKSLLQQKTQPFGWVC
jgi:hypothetical protein